MHRVPAPLVPAYEQQRRIADRCAERGMPAERVADLRACLPDDAILLGALWLAHASLTRGWLS